MADSKRARRLELALRKKELLQVYIHRAEVLEDNGSMCRYGAILASLIVDGLKEMSAEELFDQNFGPQITNLISGTQVLLKPSTLAEVEAALHAPLKHLYIEPRGFLDAADSFGLASYSLVVPKLFIPRRFEPERLKATAEFFETLISWSTDRDPLRLVVFYISEAGTRVYGILSYLKRRGEWDLNTYSYRDSSARPDPDSRELYSVLAQLSRPYKTSIRERCRELSKRA